MTCGLKWALCILETKNVEVQPLSYCIGRLQCTSMFRLVTCERATDGRKICISELTSELSDTINCAVDEIANKCRFLRSKAIDCNSQ